MHQPPQRTISERPPSNHRKQSSRRVPSYASLLDEAYPPLKPREWYCATWLGGHRKSIELEQSYISAGRPQHWLNIFLNIRTEPNLVIKELYGHLELRKDKKTVYEAPIVHIPDVSFKNKCLVLHTINPYDDNNDVHRTLRYAEDNELTPVFTVSKVVLADGTEKTFEGAP
jgi:hypothetical protein